MRDLRQYWQEVRTLERSLPEWPFCCQSPLTRGDQNTLSV